MKVKRESVDKKIDNLAIIVAKGFDSIHKEIDEKVDGLAVTVAKGFDGVYKEFDNVYKEFDNVHKEFDNVHKEINELRREVNQGFEDHIKTVRTDYDSLTGRVKQLEIARK